MGRWDWGMDWEDRGTCVVRVERCLRVGRDQTCHRVWGTSIACQRRRKAILVVSSGEGNLPRQDCHLAGDVPSWAPRTTLCKTDIRSRPLWRHRTRWWGQSYIVRRSLHQPFSRARVGHARSRAKRAPAKSSPRDRGAVPADLDVLWCLARATEATRPPRRCMDDQASSLQRHK